jgi:VirE N-terminal domain/Primase C terminal 1 (PriCT-1)
MIQEYKMSKATIFKNISPNDPFYIPIDMALARIKEGKSKELVEKIRAEADSEKRNILKRRLPCICFSGKFSERYDNQLIEHSGFIVLDFDHVNIEETLKEASQKPYIYAAWISPSGDGLKVLALINDGSKHRSHFKALRQEFIEHEEGVVLYEKDGKTPKSRVDRSGINESRICFESYDPNIYINKNAIPFEGLIEESSTKEESTSQTADDISKLVKWLAKDNRYFVSGERNTFIFVLACACCRYGIEIEDCKQFCYYEFYQNSSDFTKSEGDKAIESAYRTERKNFGTVSFKKGELVNSKGEEPTFDGLRVGDKVKDVVYADDVHNDVFSIINDGRKGIKGILVEKMDKAFKQMRGQVNLLSGYGNHGKSVWLKWYLCCRAVLYGEKYALFPPEEGGADEFYLSLMEIILGCDLTPNNRNRPSKEKINECFEFVKSHFFYIYPKEASPTPEYIKERCMFLMFTEGISGLVIDPFNQLTNDYKSYGGKVDLYLEYLLSDFDRFATVNDLYFWIVAHPTKTQKNKDGGYDPPTEYDISGGAMWNNKIYNILIYHRPFAWSDPSNPSCELYQRKIKKNRVNGERGFITFEYDYIRKRFIFDGYDVLSLNKIVGEGGIKPSISNFEKESTKSLENTNPVSNFASEEHDLEDNLDGFNF